MELPAFTLANYATLLAAIAQGAKSVEYADKKIEYNSMDEMLRLLAIMRSELNPSSKPPRIRHTAYTSGHFPTT